MTARPDDVGRTLGLASALRVVTRPPRRPSLASRIGAQVGAACMIGLVLLWSVALALGAVAVIVLSWRAIV